MIINIVIIVFSIFIRKIFIGGLSYSTDEGKLNVNFQIIFLLTFLSFLYFYWISEKLKKYFKTYGAVQDAVVMKDPISKRSRGFGFITFTDSSSVDNALAHEPHTIDSRKVLYLIHAVIVMIYFACISF